MVLGLLLLALVVSCNLFLPERFAVNAPMAAQMFGFTIDAPTQAQVESRYRVPEGYSLSLWASDLGKVRWLKTTATGDLIATLPRTGEVILLESDAGGDGQSDGRRVLLEGLNRPHGIELYEGWLYIGETDAVGRVRFDDAGRDLAEVRTIVGRTGMRLFEADLELEQTRWHLAQEDHTAARESLGKARELVEDMGYGRRRPEVEALEAELG